MTKPPDPFGELDDDDFDDDEEDVRRPDLGTFSRVLDFMQSGPRRVCEGCEYWIEEDEPRYKLIRLFPEIEEREYDMSVGPAPFFNCVQCFRLMENEGQILIEPKE